MGTPYYIKTILCLANSRKISGRCIAGRELVAGGYGNWVRPVSARPTQEVSEEERRYEDGRDPEVLQIVRVPLSAAKPHLHQTENHAINDGYYWVRERVIGWQEVLRAVEGPASLWVTGHSSYNGQNDKVPEGLLHEESRSLYLIKPQDLTLAMVTEGQAFGNPRRRLRARFGYGGVQYNLVVTDPVCERQYFTRPDSEERVANAILCVSLADVFAGAAYKLVATVITPDRVAE